MSELRIEDREHAALEFFPARHRERNGRRRIASNAGYDVQQVLGVVCRPRAAREREIVARALALGAKLLGRLPHQRMEPVHRAGDAAQGVSDQIVAANVRELVQQYCATAIERPAIAFCRKNDRRL